MSIVGVVRALSESHVVATAPPANLTPLFVNATLYVLAKSTLHSISGITVALFETDASARWFVVTKPCAAAGLWSFTAPEPEK